MDIKQATELVSIDELELQEECVRLPTNYLRVSFQAAELRNTLAKQEITYKETEAKLSKSVRDYPAKHGIEKPTRDAVDEVVAALPELNKLRQNLQETRFELDKAGSVLAALEMKKRSLANLVSLYSMGYHGQVKSKSREEREKADDAIQRKVADKTAIRRGKLPDNDDDED